MSPLRWGLALSGWAALAAVTFLPDAAVLRVLVTTAFLLVCPGLAAARWARPASARATSRTVVLETAVLTVVVGMSLSVLVVEALYLSGTFTVTRALLALAVVTSLLALLPQPGGPPGRVRRVAPDDGPPTATDDGDEPPSPEGGALPEGGASRTVRSSGRLAAAMVAGSRW
nr:hypothetical protein OG999_07715 [Streptomyces sp. NBC_00886]